ncbi:unnamed protein product [marine sediment metagenome]|uniref:Uncharacterized protein n=1 Tax=marine sediment metagenome TaxID=412755 RepID=X1R757_9ZZZZ
MGDEIEIKVGYLGATTPTSWWTELLCKIIGASTWHWFMFVVPDTDGWIITESIGKGVALTRFDYEKSYIYRIKGLEVSPEKLISIISYYGAYRYDWDVAFKTALWWFLKHYFGKLIPRYHDKEVNCQEWVCLLAAELGVKIIPDGEYPMCTNLERSPYLEELGVRWFPIR